MIPVSDLNRGVDPRSNFSHDRFWRGKRRSLLTNTSRYVDLMFNEPQRVARRELKTRIARKLWESRQ